MGSFRDFGVQKELEEVETRIRESIRSDEPLLSEIASYVIDSGGKRLRPAVAILAFKAAGGTDPKEIIDLAAAFELIHSATLIHDDINDGGEMRRGRVSAHRRYGVQNALVTGDFLYVRGFAIGGKFLPAIVDLTAAVCAALAEGEIKQKRRSRDTTLTREEYLDIINRKTAMPISANARIGAMLADASPELVSDMADYGHNVGMAFQIVDDVLDIVGEPRNLGKPIGTDIREGNVTLLAIHALNDGGSIDRNDLVRIISRKRKEEEHVRRAMRMIRDSGAVESTLRDAREFIESAKDSLRRLPAKSEYRAQMTKLADFVVERDH